MLFLAKLVEKLRKETKEKLPQWFMEETPKELILSNDIDSLLSVRLLEQIKPNWRLKYFYDFESGLYLLNEQEEKRGGAVGVDIALDKNIKTFDNHVTSDNNERLNPNSINLNNLFGISSGNYSQKYCCSTAMLIYSIFDIPLPSTDIGKALLLAIDSTYFSYYNPIAKNRPDWLKVHQHWVCDILELPELYELEQAHKVEDFDRFSFINRAKIQVTDDLGNGNYQMYFPLDRKSDVEKYLEISLDVPDGDFKLKKEVRARSCYLNGLHKADIMDIYNVISFAMTGKNHCNYSIVRK